VFVHVRLPHSDYVNLANAPRHNKQLTATLAHSKPTRHNILTTKPNQIGHYLQVSTTTTRINYRNFGLEIVSTRPPPTLRIRTYL